MVIFEYNHKEKTIFDSSEQTSRQVLQRKHNKNSKICLTWFSKKATFWPSLSFRKISSKVHQYLKILKPHYPWIYFNLVRKKLTFCSFGFTTLNSNSSVLMKFIDNSSLITQYKLITTKLKRILLEDIFNRDMFTVILNDIYDLKRKAVFSISKWQVFELSWVS